MPDYKRLTDAQIERRLRRIARTNGQYFRKLRGTNPHGACGPARYILSNANNTLIAEWATLDEADSDFTKAANHHDYLIVEEQELRAIEEIGRWIAEQRAVYQAGTLSKARIAKLELIPGWTWEPKPA